MIEVYMEAKLSVGECYTDGKIINVSKFSQVPVVGDYVKVEGAYKPARVKKIIFIKIGNCYCPTATLTRVMVYDPEDLEDLDKAGWYFKRVRQDAVTCASLIDDYFEDNGGEETKS